MLSDAVKVMLSDAVKVMLSDAVKVDQLCPEKFFEHN